MTDKFSISYVPLPRLWCNRPSCGWSKTLPNLKREAVEQAKHSHVVASHTADTVGSAGP